MTFYVFFAIAGITPDTDEVCLMQVGRKVSDPIDGFLAEKRFLILDRDSRYSTAFRNLLEGAGTRVHGR